MGENLTRKLIRAHLLEGLMSPGEEIALAVDQTLVQDATGTLVWQQFHTFGLPRVRTRVSVTYVDHNILQTGFENADDHLFLQSMCARYGTIFSRPGNGISHFAHLERFDRPGDVLIGSDSHTCTAGATGMLAIGAGGVEVAAAMAGAPFHVKMPRVVRVNLVERLGPWVAAKDVILELLRRLTVKGGLGRVFEYVGPAVEHLTVYQRATICNMTQELGATSGLFPSDRETRRFLRAQEREAEWRPLEPDADATYDEELTIDLSRLEPLIARPHSPDNVVPVREVAGTPVVQVAVGSSVNSGYADLMLVARVLEGRHVAPGVSMTMSPGSRQIFANLLKTDAFKIVTLAGVRALEIACGPCIGMGAAPPSRGHSVRTFNRNFPGRSGTADDSVWLCSPEVAVATALTGAITDPRTLGEPPRIEEPERYELYTQGFIEPPADGSRVDIYTGPNIIAPPEVPPLPERAVGRVLLRLGDNVSTDEIIPAGNEVLPLRSNIPAISEYTFRYVDPSFPRRAKEAGGGFVVAGENYGQGSSREHAAATVMYLGVRAVLARSYARIHESNLVNFGIPPLRFADPSAYEAIAQGDELDLVDLARSLERGREIVARNLTRGGEYRLGHALSSRQLDTLLSGGLSRHLRQSFGGESC